MRGMQHTPHRRAPELECDVIMQGGVTSGVVYPRALTRFARTYRLRNLGGSSAGAIGAALGAAAEHGRASGLPGSGFAGLDAVPAELHGGGLTRLFTPERATRPLLPLLLAVAGAPRAGRARGIAWALLSGWPLPAVAGVVPGLAVLALAFTAAPPHAIVLAVLGVLTAVAGCALGVGLGVRRTLTRAVPANLFGICTGLGTPDEPGFTDWLSRLLDTLAGRRAGTPLLHGHLWTGGDRPAHVPEARRAVNLRTVSTCLTQGRPYEMPSESTSLFYEPAVWERLFPPEVMAALAAAPPARGGRPSEVARLAWEDAAAAARPRPLRRLPAPAHLPVVVSVRMSVSFPLLFSAVPLWALDRRSPRTAEALRAVRAGVAAADPDFTELWFTDGGFTSNFPVHLFDAALPTRPTFAINLGTFVPDRVPSDDEAENIEYARDNGPLPPSHRPIPATGWAAITAFVRAAFSTVLEWPDATQLGTPGMRDRVVRVLQAPSEGGLNLDMGDAVIDRLARRGAAAADAMVDMFTRPHYPGGATGWDNHRWVRYRALYGTLPRFLSSWRDGHAAASDLDPVAPPSYRLSGAGRLLAAEIDDVLAAGAEVIDAPGSAAGVADLTAAPRPATVLRRVPQW